MLSFRSLSLRRGTRLLLEDVDIIIHAGQKIGITGANGCGKSSLFALIRAELTADAGDVQRPAGLRIAHVAQETPSLEQAAIDYVLDGDSELRGAQADLARSEASGDGHAHAEALEHLHGLDAYTARSRAATLMHGLGFRPDQDEVRVSSLSGGWRMRLNLARALMARSDLLLLDEPTNHLDLDAVIWLEDWLRRYPGTLLLISHDREFLDRVVAGMLHFEAGGMHLYRGNYSAFESQRAERLAQQQAAHERQQREVRHVQSFVERFRAKATKARQAQSRLKALERMEMIAPAHVDSAFHFEFPEPARQPNPLLKMEDVALGYDDTVILKGITRDLAPGSRIGLLGHNGAGKSTLVRLLAGELAPLAGDYRQADGLVVGYFAQHQLEQLDPEASPLLHLQRQDGQARDQDLRNYLGGFGFAGERADAPVAPFSGGEKARLVLAMLTHQAPQLLLLDEPTNHLDLEMRHALTMALQDFQGAMVLVSHDRHLLRTTTDQLWLVHAGRVGPFEGDLEAYPAWLADQRRAAAVDDAAVKGKAHSAASRKDKRRDEAQRRKALQPLRNRERKLERQLDELSARLESLRAELGEPSIYEDSNRDRLQGLLAEEREVAARQEAVEEEWLEVSGELEGLG